MERQFDDRFAEVYKEVPELVAALQEMENRLDERGCGVATVKVKNPHSPPS
jgi:hypothetical protein